MNVRAFERRDTPHVADLLEEMPEAFTAQGRQLFLRDATTQSALVAEDNEGPTGVLVWCATAAEVELLWLAVAKRARRQGIASRLISEAVLRAPGALILCAKTADPSSLSAPSGLSAESYLGTLDFFATQRFDIVASIPDYWVTGNTALVLLRRLWREDDREESARGHR